MPRPTAAADIRETFLAFFEAKGHTRVPSGSLIPESDPTLLFTNAGMVPFKRVFTGEETRPYARATSTQKVMRVSGKHNDLEEVGRSARHHTFFEMLGNFSFGDYFKQEAIAFAWELLTEGYGFTMDQLVVSVFREDDESAEIWEREIGFPPGKIYRLDEAENFWSMGDTGPCGPCTEIHLDRGPIPGVEDDDPSSDSGRFLEFWNLVFMQYDRDASGTLNPLPKPSVDTGLGLERTACILQGKPNTYETDVFTPILARAQELSGVALGSDPDHDVSLKVVADHARSCAFLIGDGVMPANEGRGYVLRRILRRAARHGVLLGIDEPFLYRVSDAVIDQMGGVFPELAERRAFIVDRVRREEERFLQTLSKGLALLEAEIGEAKAAGAAALPGRVLFRLYDTFGFPLDLTQDILRSHEIGTDDTGFQAEMDAQRARSREAWQGSGDESVAAVYGRMAGDLETSFRGYERLEGTSEIRALIVAGAPAGRAEAGSEVEVVVPETPFYAESGGQVGDQGTITTAGGRVEVADTQRPSGELVVHRGKVVEGAVSVGEEAELSVDAGARAATVRNHTGTHLLHAALRAVLGPQAMQKGSLVAPDRLRFDFTHDAPLTDDEIERIEDLANGWIEANDGGQVREMPYKDALAAGAVALFGEKYGDDVRVVSFGDVSTELCGGTHARATGDIGLLKIVSETGIAAGVRRIEALTGLGALAWLRGQQRALRRTGEMLRVPAEEVPERVAKLLDERKAVEKQISDLRRGKGTSSAADLAGDARDVGGVKVLATRQDGLPAKDLRGMVDDLRDQIGSGVVLLASEHEGKLSLALGVTSDLKGRLKAGDLVREVASVVGGRGGGRPDFGQAGASDASQLPQAFERLYELVGGIRVSALHTSSPFAWRRRPTRAVPVGDVAVGGANPIRVQSMTTTDTLDTEGTIDQVARLAAAGCEIVRITAPSKREAENLAAIKAGLLARGVGVPLVADIHFTPNAAMEAALHVEKVRINPGNYADKKRFEVREYSDAQYADEVARVAERFRPLVLRCKDLGRALRIGTNHGSLSDRILNRFGDTPRGMVESALEFLDVCEGEGFHDVVFSMKASNAQVAIQAYRLLASALSERETQPDAPSYPFHVGVTEAGDGEDGRVKSAIGIGALLEDGIGDTIRVSLTEDPVKEVPVARALAARYDAREPAPAPADPGGAYVADPFAHARRATRAVGEIGADHPVRVEADLGPVPPDADAAAALIETAIETLGDVACEGLLVDADTSAQVAGAGALADALRKRGMSVPLAVRVPPALAAEVGDVGERVVVRLAEPVEPAVLAGLASHPSVEWNLHARGDALVSLLDAALATGARPGLVSVECEEPVHAGRLLVARLAAAGLADLPVVLRHRADALADAESALVAAGTDLGALLCDGIGDLVSLGGFGSLERDVRLAYRILQGARLRTSWTEFISCPSCGRTLFDLEETTARIKDRTAHLPGVKIAVMGCIVNGPGEMADADFGYVGSGKGMVSLYVGHDCVIRNVPEADAPDRLVDLIREHGAWVDPEPA